jgi:ATP-dependent DNA helicase DinG
VSPLPPPSRPRPGGAPNRPAIPAPPASPIYVTVDVEATANERHDEIIEVAAVTFTSERILDRWTSLVRPIRPVPLGTSQLTGITNAMLQAAPPFANVAPQLRAFVKNYPIVGQSVDFDLKRLVAHGLTLENPTYDTYELATLLLPDLPVYSLTRIAERLQVGTPQEHRALGDCELTAAVFRALLEKIAECDMETLGELSRLADLGQSPFARLFRQAQREKQQGTFGGGAGASILQQLRAQAGGGQAEKEGGVDLLYLMPRPRPEPLRNTGSQKALDTRAILDTFRPDGPFAEAFPHYEHRPQQMDMLEAVADAFNKDETLLVEAGTGTGKSVAYLVPAVAHAVEHGETVVVSTATIALQDQLAKKDIPDLQEVLAAIGGAPAPNGAGLPAEFRATIVKGRANYLCLYRWFKLRGNPALSPAEARLMLRLLLWLQSTDTGDIGEIRFTDDERRLGVMQAWNRVNAGPDSCPSSCVFQKRGQCFVQRARRAAENAHIGIGNHALLLSDMTTNSGVLPPYEHLIVDEAHHLEDEATNQLGYAFERATVLNFLNLLAEPHAEGPRGLLTDLPIRVRTGKTPKDVEADVTRLCGDVLPRVDEARTLTIALFDRLAAFLAGRPQNETDTRLRITQNVRNDAGWSEVEIAWDDLSLPLSMIQQALMSIFEQVYRLPDETIQEQDDTLLLLTRALRVSTDLRVGAAAALAEPDPDMVYWTEVEGQRGFNQQAETTHALMPGLPSVDTSRTVSVKAAPLHVGATLQADLFGPRRSVVMTSATMTTEGKFDYLGSRLGIDRDAAVEVAVDSPFDYRRSALLYTVEDMPEPNRPGYQKGLQDAIIGLCEATRGRALVLFTSYSALQATYRAVKPVLEAAGIVVLGQRLDGGPRQLIERFKQHQEMVLFGTSSFWEGVDVVGDALSLLVITKLPFKVPSDPVFQARSEGFVDPFVEFAVPQAVLQFRQGFGRLIRSSTDRGVCAVLDSRVLTKRYGRTFLNSLPGCTVEKGRAVDLPARAAAWLAMAGPQRG